MACGRVSCAILLERSLRSEYAAVAVPPDRRDLRPGRSPREGAWLSFVRTLRGVFLVSRREADRGPNPEPYRR